MPALIHRLVRAPTIVSWDRLLTLLGLWITIVLGLVSQGLPAALGWVLVGVVCGWAIWKKATSPDLRIAFDPAADKEYEDDRLLYAFVTVQNNSGRTVDDVSLRVVDLRDAKGVQYPEYVDRRVHMAGTGSGAFRPYDKATTLHDGESARFYVARVDRLPGTHVFTGVTQRAHAHRAESKSPVQYRSEPSERLPTGRYIVTLAAQGRDTRGETASFEFWGTEERSFFVRSRSRSRVTSRERRRSEAS